MKQLLLRIDDDVHARLRERARRENRSINAIAGDILAVAATVDPESPRDRLKLRAAALGMLATPAQHDAEEAGRTDPSRPRVDMDEIARLTAGWGPQVDQIFAEDRERL